jgi:uncharacterized protein (DUF58 family)
MNKRLFDKEFLRRLERLALISRRALIGQVQGERRSPKRGQSVEFADFRPYVAGDDIRRIDWNAYARLERFFIKLFIEEEDLTVHILIDNSRSMDWGQPNKLEYAIRIAGAVGYVALSSLDQVTVTALSSNGKGVQNTYFPSKRGKRNAIELFNFLLSIPVGEEPRSDHSLSLRLNSYAATMGRPGPLLLLSDLMNDGWQQGLGALATHGFEVTILHILSPDEISPELYGDFRLLDSENGPHVEVTADFDTLDRYRQNLKDWQKDWRRFCLARAMQYLPIQTTMPLDELLFARLRQRGILR